MPDNWFHGLIPTPREGATISEAILVTTAAMRKNGTFDTDSLCWSPAELECLAMFAIDSKNKLAQPSAARRDVLEGPWELRHPMITSDEGEVYEGGRWDIVPKVGATVKGIACTFPFDCEDDARAVCEFLNARALASSPRDGRNQEKS